jgi:protein ImuB
MYACIYARDLSQECHRRLIDCAGAFSPSVETAADHVILDLRGLHSLFGGPDDIAARMRERVAAAGLDANIAIAATPETAAIAARGCPGVTVIRPGEEVHLLANLPMYLLSEDEETLSILSDWGVRTFGDFSRLPETGIADRLGAAGVSMHRLARGVTDRPLTALRDVPPYTASAELEHALDSLEPLSFVLSRLLHEICGRLASDARAANEMRLELELDDKSTFVRTLRLPFATRETSTFLRLLQYDLAAHPPGAAILRVILSTEPVDPRVVQHGLFIPMAPQPEKLELTLARICAIVGEENTGSPELLDTHRPGAFRMVRFDASHRQPRGGDGVLPRLAIRIFRPPLAAEVSASNGRPVRIRARGISGNIIACAGPWRISGDWWTPIAWQRDEWDVEFETGGLYRVYRDGLNGWFVEGNYD